jgi:hypothetical protein
MDSHHLYEKLTQYYRDKGIVSLSREIFDLIPETAYEELHQDLLRAIRLQSIGKKILETIRTEIFLSFKFFGLALSHFQEASGDTLFFQITPTLTTNGKAIYFNAQWLINRFKQNPRQLIRDYLHVLFHTIFKHHHLAKALVEVERWNLAADITVEYLIDQFSGFMAGKSRTSLMLLESESSMVSLSIPIPQPPVGGRPYSREVTKF